MDAGTAMRMRDPRQILASIGPRVTRLIQRLQGKRFLHLLHIGKTGGTALTYAIERYQPERGPYVISVHPHGVRLSDIPRGEGVLFFLRDPVSRFVSGFYSRQRQGQPRYFYPWTPGERAAFEHFTTPGQLATALYSTDVNQRERARTAIRSIEHLRCPYWYWFENEEYFRARLEDVFFIGFQERLNEDFEILKAMLGWPAEATLPTDDVLAHRNVSHLDRTLDEDAVANVKRWYQDDYVLIELCRHVAVARRMNGA